jgi:transposase InsO family protein
MVAFIDEHRSVLGVEPICKELPIAPSNYYRLKNLVKHPEQLSARYQLDQRYTTEIRRVWEENHEVYGARKVWRQLQREGFQIARCTTERLMKAMGLQGVTRGRTIKRTTIPSKNAPKPLDLVQRAFYADRPNQLWVADFTYVATWSRFVFVAFIIDAFSRMIVGWRAMKRMTTDMTLDALEQAIWARKLKGSLIHHSDRGSQYLSIRYSERLAEEGIIPSVGSVGDAYDNALAETVIGLFKTEVIYKKSPWKTYDAVEYATLDWISWFNTKRLLEPIGNIPPAEYENLYYTQEKSPAISAGLT